LNWYANWYYITPITFSFLINPLILKNFGLSQILSCSLTAIGLWILVLVKQSFYLGLVGFMFLGFGEASYYQVPLRIYNFYLDLSKIWFEPKERIFSTFVA
jgi:FLVCR family feline leukemia virus subgroup C receptor-related protein